jgi:hypothetical protein
MVGKKGKKKQHKEKMTLDPFKNVEQGMKKIKRGFEKSAK